jgi:hypothetical protein
MIEVDDLLGAALSAIPRSQVAALIDLASGMFLGVQPQPDDTSALDLFAASVKEVYEGDLAEGLRLSSLDLAERRAGSEAVRLNAVRLNVFVIAGDDVLHVMVRMAAQPNLVLAVSCPASANIGMSLVKARHLAMTHAVEGV